MDQNEDLGLEERLKSALWFSIGKIVDEETIKLGVNATPQFIGALTELVWVQIGMTPYVISPQYTRYGLRIAAGNTPRHDMRHHRAA
ncbi:hypothetical protein BJY00DRAFT_314888 [Aspergillus carlsbadensis]|nr:hypothetical protein BJY00DRAFT_314888 [Aspergillus carlsbadensis]